MNKQISIFFCLLYVLFSVGIEVPGAFCQTNHMRFRHIDVEQGLPSNTVWSIVQDTDGFMWFGTNNGLARYDGSSFEIYKHQQQDSLSLSNSRIIDLLVDHDGTLWIGTAGGLNCYDRKRDQFIRFDAPAFKFNYIRCLMADHSNQLWIGTTDGLFQFDTHAKEFVHNGTYREKPYAFADKNIYNITQDDSGTLWLSTTEGLFLLENGNISRASVKGHLPLLASNTQFRDVLIDTQGNYWIATESLEEGVFRFNSRMELIEDYTNIEEGKQILAGNRVRVIRQLSDGNIWLGCYNGLSVYYQAEGTFRTFQADKYDPNSLSHNSVRDIYEDHDGGIWLATYRGGVNYFHPGFQKFHHEREELWTENSLSDNLVSSFAEDGKGNLWIGTDDGLNYLDVASKRFTRYFRGPAGEGLLDNAIKSIIPDHHQGLWIGSQRGLSYLDLLSKQFKHFVHDPENERTIGYGHVHSIYHNDAGVTWLGINGSGLNKYESSNNTFVRFSEIENEENELVDTHVLCLEPFKNNFLWVGTETGLELFDMKKGLFTRHKMIADGVFESVSSLIIPTLYLDTQEHLWIGTHENGVYVYNTMLGALYILDRQVGLPSNAINGILEDKEGNMWISTNRGISKLIKPENGWKSLSAAHIMNFNVTDGLQGLQFYPNSALSSQDGQMYFGGTNGYNSFHPEEVHKDIIHPNVVINGIRFRNENTPGTLPKRYVPNDSIVIDQRLGDFSIEFAALYYFDPGSAVYAYKMEPADKSWNIIGNERVVNYSKLPPGDYLFKVRATNDAANWDDNVSQLSITVLPPFWLAWWAYIVYMFVLIALLYVFFSMASKWGKLKSDLLWEHREREKEHDQHQLRLKFFTDISHELRTPLTLILAPLERLVSQYTGSARMKNQLLMIQRNGERMLQLINQLLDLRKLETGHMNLRAGYGNVVKFVHEVSLAFRETVINKNISYDVTLDDRASKIWFDRDKLEIVLYNLLSNAVKYTPEGGHIRLSLQTKETVEGNAGDFLQEGFVEIIVEDSGKGIPAEHLERIFERFYQADQHIHETSFGSGVGLEIVKKYVELHKGTITVESVEATPDQPGKTRFVVRLPKGKSHLKDSEVIEDFRTSEDISLYTLPEVNEDSVNNEHQDLEVIPKLQQEDVAGKSLLLVVEDNDEVRRFIASLFTANYNVSEAANGKLGLEIALEKIPDLVISDIMMPVMDGLELCKHLKTDPRTSHVPVILLTARTAVTFQIEGMETGADDYLTKPFSAELLKSRASNLIEQRKKLRQKFSKGPALIPEEISVTSVDEKLLKKAIDFINKHIEDANLSVEVLAEEIGMSRVHLYRKMKALTDLSPNQFIRLIRLERAAQLLDTGKMNISEVRYAVGFQDADYFRNAFKEHFGHTPSEHTI